MMHSQSVYNAKGQAPELNELISLIYEILHWKYFHYFTIRKKNGATIELPVYSQSV